MTAPALARYIQGQGSVGADNLNTFQQTCDTISQLRSFVGLTGIQVFVRGGTAIADGQQGVFYWNAAATGPDNGTSIIVPVGSARGAWIRLTFAPPFATPQMFGAYGDLVHDDTTAINLAISTRLPVLFEAASSTGGFLTDGGHQLTTAGQFLGGSAIIRKKNATVQSVFYVPGTSSVTLNLRVDGNRAAIGTNKAVRCVQATRAPNLKIYGEYFNSPDDGVQVWNCPSLYVDASTWMHDNYNIGLEIKSYTYNPNGPSSTAIPWVGDPLYCSGTIYGLYERNNDTGLNNGTGVDFSEVNNSIRSFSDGAITATTPNFTTNIDTFTLADQGKVITIGGAGTGGTANLTTTILVYIGPRAVTLATNAITTVGPTASFSVYDAATIPVRDITVGGTYRDNVRGIWTENNDFGGEAINIVIDHPVIENNVTAGYVSYYGIGIIAAKNVAILGPVGHNIATADAGGVNTAFITLSASTGVTQNDSIGIVSPLLLEDSGLSNRVEYGMHLDVCTNVQVTGDRMTGFRTAEYSLGTLVTNFTRDNTLASYTVSQLNTLFPPAKCANGMRSFVTDANATTFGATVAGGGSTPLPVFNNTSNWKTG